MVERGWLVSIAALATALAAGAAAAALLGLWDATPLQTGYFSGPLVGGEPAQGSGFIADAGGAISLGGVEVFNPGREPVTLVRVRPVDPDPGIRVLGAFAGQRRTRGTLHAVRGFPPRQPPDISPSSLPLPDLAPLEGYVVRPQPGVQRERVEPTQLFIGLESTIARGRETLRSFRLEYRVGKRRHELVLPYAVAICTPRSEYAGVRPCRSFLPGESSRPP